MSLLALALRAAEQDGTSQDRLAKALAQPSRSVKVERRAAGMGPDLEWNEDKVYQAKLLFMERGMSATDVAKIVGVSSRHAVLGVAFRNGWERPDHIANDNARKARQRRGRAPVELPRTTRKRRFRPKTLLVRLPDPLPTLPEKPDTITIAPRHWLSREEGECAYPVSGSGADTLSCCNPCDARYCPPHRQIMYEPTRVSVSDLEHSLRKQL